MNSVYNEPTVYKQFDLQKTINDNFVELKPKVLDKYKIYVDYERFENQIVLYNKITKVFAMSSGFLANTSFIPFYENTDPHGDLDWPVFAFFEIPHKITYNTGKYFPLCSSANVYNKWGLTSFSDDDTLCIRLTKNFTIPTGYNFLLSGIMQLN